MATNKLMEAAAEILAGSKKSAPGMPMQKPEGAKVHDAGGPTPQNYKYDDNSAKLNPSDGAPGNAPAPTTKPSAASSDTQLGAGKMKLGTGKATMEQAEEDEEDLLDDGLDDIKAQVREDVNSMFGDDTTISEDFKAKAATIFEARVLDRVGQIQEQLESEYASVLEEAVEQIKEDLTEKVDDYLNYVVEQWVDENQIAI